MIDVADLVVRYGAAVALDEVSLTVRAGELVALIGPSGAGKSTVVNALTRIVRPYRGSVKVRGRLAQVPQGRQVFGDLTVEDNLRLGGWRVQNRDTGPVYEMLPGLVALRHQLASGLCLGQRLLVGVGRALMRRPEVLVIDELSLGVAPHAVANLVRQLRELNAERGLAVLVVGQNAGPALDLCSRAYLLREGRIVAEGPSDEIAMHPELAPQAS